MDYRFSERLKILGDPEKRVCVLTGAGVSRESGIPTFRGVPAELLLAGALGRTAQEPRRTVKPVPSNVGGVPSIKRGCVQLSLFVPREIMYTPGGATVRSVCGAPSLACITQVR